MARALNPARVDALGWYLHPLDGDIDQCRRLRRVFEDHSNVEEIAGKFEDMFPQAAAEQQQAAAAEAALVIGTEDRSDLDTESAAKSSGEMEDSPVDRYFFTDHEGDFISLAELRLDGDPESSAAAEDRPKFLLKGMRNSVSIDEVQVKAWRVEFSGTPSLFVQDLQNKWIPLKSPLPLYQQDVGKEKLSLLDFLNSIKAKELPSPSLSEEVMRKHSALLKKLVARDPELTNSSVIQSMLKKRKPEELQPSSSKRLKEAEETVAEMEGQEGEADLEVETDDEEVEGDEELGESICSICDDGGNLLCCDGPCLRSFHSDCLNSRGAIYARLKQSFYCRNCSQNQHQCFACGRLGSSQGPAQEVFICDVALCGRFYHRSCVSKLLGGKDCAQGFVCPLHTCFKCHKGDGGDKASWLYECRRCPRAWHRACAEEKVFGGDEARHWIIGKTRFLFCMQHKLDPDLETPKRDHVRFPAIRPEFRKPVPQKEKAVKPRESKAEIETPLLAIIEASKQAVTRESIENDLQKPRTVASAPNRNCQMNKLRSLLDALNKACLHVDNGGSIEESRMIFPLEQMLSLEQSKEALKVYLSPLLHGNCYSTYGRHFTATEKLEEVVNRLCWYVCHGDTIADLCCGDNTFSRKLSRRLGDMKVSCRYKNYDLFPPSDTFCFERRDYMTIRKQELGNPNGLIMGLNPPFGVNGQTASRFAKFVAAFRPKLIILIAPKETERLEKSGYVLTWEDKTLLKGNAFYLPGSTDVNGKAISHDNLDAPVLSLWSRADWKDSHKRIAEERGHLRFGVESCSLDIVTEPFADLGKLAGADSPGKSMNLEKLPEAAAQPSGHVSRGGQQEVQGTGSRAEPGSHGRRQAPFQYPPRRPPFPGHLSQYRPYRPPHFQAQGYQLRAFPPVHHQIQELRPRTLRPPPYPYPYPVHIPWPQSYPFPGYGSEELHPPRPYFPARGNNRHFFR